MFYSTYEYRGNLRVSIILQRITWSSQSWPWRGLRQPWRTRLSGNMIKYSPTFSPQMKGFNQNNGVILVRIRIRFRGSVPLTNGSGSDSFLQWIYGCKKIIFFSYFFLLTCPQPHYLQSQKLNFLPKFCVKILFFEHRFNSLNTFMRTVKDPEPDLYLWLMDPDTGGPTTYGSGSPTLVFCILI